jgi:predicted adenylyl cyclase CyaB
MIELELKSVVSDMDRARQRLIEVGARLVFQGSLEDRRYDTPDRKLRHHDQVLRLRTARDAQGATARMEFKGPTAVHAGYKRREEIGTGVTDIQCVATMLQGLGYEVTMAIDREIWQYELHGATVRLERYPRMDDLVEVEGGIEAIEQAIACLGMPREGFTSERLRDFVWRYETRTGQRAAVCNAALDSGTSTDWLDG